MILDALKDLHVFARALLWRIPIWIEGETLKGALLPEFVASAHSSPYWKSLPYGVSLAMGRGYVLENLDEVHVENPQEEWS